MNMASSDSSTRIALFQRKEIRRTLHNGEWWFVVTDVIAALTDSMSLMEARTRMGSRSGHSQECVE